MVAVSAGISESVKERVTALDGKGRAAFERGEFSTARECFEQAAQACREAGWREELIYQLLHVTQAMAREPGYEPAGARALLAQALEIANSTGQARWILPVQINRIRLYLQEGRFSEGLRLIQESLPGALSTGFEDFAGSLVQFAAFACVGMERFHAALLLNSAAQAQRDREGVVITERLMRESMERNMAPARRAFSAGKCAAVEALGYQMTLAEAGEYVLGLEVEDGAA